MSSGIRIEHTKRRKGNLVGDFKAMPYSEKCDMALDSVTFSQRQGADFVREHLGDQASSELWMTYQEGIRPIPEGASADERYEAAYRNWIWVGMTNFGFIRERMGEEGIDRFVDFEVEALKRKNASPSLFVLRAVRALSPKTAFQMTAKELTYRLQWITPYSVSKSDPGTAVVDIPRCKVLDDPAAADLCRIGCLRVYPRWVAEQFKVSMDFDPQGHRCRCTLTLLS
jgi:hypothetical protein